MTNKEFFIETFANELPIFIRVMKAVEATPKAKHTSYTHDPKTRHALDLISQSFGIEALSFLGILKNGKVDFGAQMKKSKWKNVSDVRKLFEKNMKEVLVTLKKMKDTDWDKPAQMVSGKTVQWETTRGNMMWGLLLDLIHHRGQLSTYIRPMGGKVPSIYGPSADTV